MPESTADVTKARFTSDELLRPYLAEAYLPLPDSNPADPYNELNRFCALITERVMAGGLTTYVVYTDAEATIKQTWTAGSLTATVQGGHQLVFAGTPSHITSIFEAAIRHTFAADDLYLLERVNGGGYRLTLKTSRGTFTFTMLNEEPEPDHNLVIDGEEHRVTERNLTDLATLFTFLADRHPTTVDIMVGDNKPVMTDQATGGMKFVIPERGDRLVVTQAPNWNEGIVIFPGIATYLWDGVALKLKNPDGLVCVTFLKN